MKEWTKEVCPVCGSMPLIKIWKRQLTKDEYIKCHKARKYTRMAYFHCGCDEVVTEWHGPRYKKNGKEESTPAEYYAAKEWNKIISRLTNTK